jgi:hypothetical protein
MVRVSGNSRPDSNERKTPSHQFNHDIPMSILLSAGHSAPQNHRMQRGPGYLAMVEAPYSCHPTRECNIHPGKMVTATRLPLMATTKRCAVLWLIAHTAVYRSRRDHTLTMHVYLDFMR